MNAVDPEGLEIKWDDNLNGSWDTLNPIIKRIKSTKVGKKMFEDMKKSKTLYTVKDEYGGSPRFDPSTNTVYLNTGERRNIMVKDKDEAILQERFDLERQIAHEFGHAWTGEGDYTNGHSDGMNMVEKTENPILVALGRNRRIDYVWY